MRTPLSVSPVVLAALLIGVSACSRSHTGSATTGADSTAAAAAPESSSAARPMSDSGQAIAGSGVPAGYVAVLDQSSAKIADAHYTVHGTSWEVQTGPAHLVFAPQDTASGIYGVNATLEQLQKPKHPEAYGIFFGGQQLDNPAKQRYGYFLVRGTGQYLIKTRDGMKTKSVVNWTSNAAVPKEDAQGHATYHLTVHVAKDTVHFLVDGKLVAQVPKRDVPAVGIAGLRINHHLHLSVTPVTIAK